MRYLYAVLVLIGTLICVGCSYDDTTPKQSTQSDIPHSTDQPSTQSVPQTTQTPSTTATSKEPIPIQTTETTTVTSASSCIKDNDPEQSSPTLEIKRYEPPHNDNEDFFDPAMQYLVFEGDCYWKSTIPQIKFGEPDEKIDTAAYFALIDATPHSERTNIPEMNTWQDWYDYINTFPTIGTTTNGADVFRASGDSLMVLYTSESCHFFTLDLYSYEITE